MKRPVYIHLLALSALALSATAGEEEDLDAALAAQKQKVRHRVYSEQAALVDRNLVVPQGPSAQEQALDAKLREKDAQAEAAIRARPATVFTPASSAVAARQTENENWLTPALLDQSASEEIPSDGTGWPANPLARKQDPRTEVPDQDQINQRVQDRLQQQNASLQMPDPLKQYQLTSQPLQSLQPSSPLSVPSASPPPGSGTSMKQTGTDRASAPVSPFSLQPAGFSAAPDPLEKSRPFGTRVSTFSEPEKQKPAVLSPLEQIKRSAPIRRDDPFSDNHIPQFKNSIWE